MLPVAHALAEGLTFEKDIKPLTDKYCVSCHNPEKTKGKFDIARFGTTAQVVEALGVWERAIKRIENREMPPHSQPQPSDDEKKMIFTWIDEVAKANSDCNQIASEESVSWYPGYVMGRRLTRMEYENTIRDLFGARIPVADLFPADGAGGEGFDNAGNALYISAIQAEKYLQAADLVIETVFPESQGDAHAPELAAARARILAVQPGKGVKPADAARQNLAAFLEHAWRRPVEEAELARLLDFFEKNEGSAGFEGAMKLALKAALVSPNFLFLAEPHPEASGVYALGDFQLASRLSYFLWATMPDEELFAAARAGALQQEDQIRAQVKRMLLDPKARALGDVFAAQWLGITQIGQTIKPDTTRFTEFNDQLAADMQAEVAAVFHRVVAEDRSLIELINADYTYANARLAALYGLQNVTGDDLQLVSLTDPNRGGVTGMAAVLTATSHPLRTSPVLRGKWVLEQLLGDHVPPPPPNVAKLPDDDAPVAGLTMRQQLEEHRKNPDCAGCHARMDPIGFGLENFDPIGRWRTDLAGQPIDAQGVLPSGETFTGPQQLKAVLLARKDDFARNLSTKMLGYALGRNVGRFDGCVVDTALKALQASDYRASELFTTIALSHPFRHRYSAGASEAPAPETSAPQPEKKHKHKKKKDSSRVKRMTITENLTIPHGGA